jgi:hypothetical protein
VYPAEDFTAVKKYGLTMMVTADDQVKSYIKKIMGQLKEWMYGGKISKLVVVITSKETGEHVERWQFDVSWHSNAAKCSTTDVPRSKYLERAQRPNRRKRQPIRKMASQSERIASTADDAVADVHTTAQARHQKRRQKPKYRLRSSLSSGKSLPRSHFYRC